MHAPARSPCHQGTLSTPPHTTCFPPSMQPHLFGPIQHLLRTPVLPRVHTTLVPSSCALPHITYRSLCTLLCTLWPPPNLASLPLCCRLPLSLHPRPCFQPQHASNATPCHSPSSLRSSCCAPPCLHLLSPAAPRSIYCGSAPVHHIYHTVVL